MDYEKIVYAIRENTLYKPDDKNYKPIDIALNGLVDSLAYIFKSKDGEFNTRKFKLACKEIK